MQTKRQVEAQVQRVKAIKKAIIHFSKLKALQNETISFWAKIGNKKLVLYVRPRK